MVGNISTTITGFKLKAYLTNFVTQLIEIEFSVTLEPTCLIDNLEVSTCLGTQRADPALAVDANCIIPLGLSPTP